MKRFGFVQAVTDRGVDINISPLIDVVFLLLIFFIVTTVFVDETGVRIEKPAAASAEQLEAESILFALTDSGDIFHGGEKVPLDSVRGIVSRRLHSRERPVILLGDQRTHLGLMVQLIDECRLGGAQTVSIAAEQNL